MPASLKPKNVLIDNVAIKRRIAGEHQIELTREEKRRAIRILHRRGLPDVEIAERLGYGHAGVSKTRKRMGLKSNLTPNQTRASRAVATAFDRYPAAALV